MASYQRRDGRLITGEFPTPEGQLVRLAAPQWILHKTLTTGQERPEA